MQSKGIIKWLAVLFALACVFQLSFTFVTRGVEAEAAKQENPQAYLDEKWDQVVYNLGIAQYTYADCKNRELNLGLDLKGGMNVMLEIKAEDVIRANAESKGAVRKDVELNARMEKALYEASKANGASAAVDAFIAASATEDLEKIFNTSDVTVLAADLKSLVDGSVSAAFNVLQNRIDLLGVTQPNIQLVTGTNRISVELPGVKEPERVGKLLASTANLEFWEVYEQGEISEVTAVLYGEEFNEAVRDYLLEQGVAEDEVGAKLPSQLILPNVYAPQVAAAEKENLETLSEYFRLPAVKALFPSDVKLAWSNKSVDGGAKGTFVLYALRGMNGVAAPVLDGTGITNARAQGGQNGGFEVSMSMDHETALTWADITERNANKQIAIVLDGYVYSAPMSHGRIDGGQSSITGNFDVQEAEDLASVLNSGKAPAPATIIYSEVVGPSLGAKAINDGLISFALAFLLVLVYMAFFYKGAGMMANIALLFNVLLLMGVLVSFGAVLTLPGIAGIVLTMGMAVDANVIIFERVKEELRAGKGLSLAIQDGFSNAYSAIIDGNLTTIITGIVLFFFGTGPVKGFATTLVAGIITSLFCSIFITRVLLESRATRKGSISFSNKLTENFLQNVKFSFISKRKVSYIVSGTLVVLSIISFCTLGLNKGIDFTGGRNYVVAFNDVEGVNTQQLASKLEANASLNGASIKVITISRENQVRITTNYELNATDDAEANLVMKQAIYDAGKELGYVTTDFDGFNNEDYIPSTQKVGPSIAEDITIGAIWAILVSLVVIALYILLRFRNVAFSIGAIVGLAANVLVILGLYCLLPKVMWFSMEIDQAFIAAILTVIGYSINDIVVVFDRIREVSGLYPNRNMYEVINESLNLTMPRTLNTSISTLLVLVVIFFCGGASIQSFIFAMLVGVVVDPMTTIFLAVPTAYNFMTKKANKKA